MLRDRHPLVELAWDVPASGQEATDWRCRGLAELLLHAVVRGDRRLLRSVDRAAVRLAPAHHRFADRLRGLRGAVGRVPAGYPRPREHDLPPCGPAAGVRRAAVALARLCDRQGGPPSPAPLPPESVVDAAEAADALDRLAGLRPLGLRGHTCLRAPVPAELIWRGWLVQGAEPVFVVAPHALPGSRIETSFGLHVGVHLDQVRDLVGLGLHEWAVRLQFGEGLLVAESVAMTAEILALAAPSRPLGIELSEALRTGIVERLARLPRLARWGVDLAPGSATMLAAAERHDREFPTLPRLAEAYVVGPFHLATASFRHASISPRLRRSLVEGWRRAGLPSRVW
ncbi:hypothetical protein [Streptomyces sp. NPDC005538]|uniref:hypothetical protein n=1 Tax=unclassified Streptomyces TaxID=2593676 RepID=UPI0033AF807D